MVSFNLAGAALSLAVAGRAPSRTHRVQEDMS
jgi:hypothetical protein